MSYKIGIDVGSTTLKTVVLGNDGRIIEKSYQRHFSRVREMTLTHILSLEHILRGHPLKVAVTGSAGLGISKDSGLEFVQEVFATAGAVKKTVPETDVVVELGGEDAKIIFLGGTLEERMNGTCAGGTGAFIDQMATLLNVTADELDQLSLKAEKIYPIASRCGVFAKSDIQPLLNQGARKEDIAASIFQAVVEQTIAGLAQGRRIAGNVLFLGGPLSFSRGLQKQFVKTLGLPVRNAVFPALAPYFVALGSAYYAQSLSEDYALTFDELISRLREAPSQTGGLSCRKPLFENEEEYGAFKSRHAAMTADFGDIESYSGKAYLGVDAGSTTTKLVLLGCDGAILYRHYVSNGGNPLPVIKEQLENIYRLCAGRIEISSSAVTGYGEELMRAAFGIDLGIVETVAHYTAARHFDPLVDFIIDIGGQDIKCFQIRDGAVDSVILNEACSSGCGSFIETFAKGLGYSAEQFAQLALFAKAPVDLGTRCTVFMNSSVKQAQKDGATPADISAGLAVSVIKNALYKVIRARSAGELGEHIVVQGGTFLNDAVLRAFEQELEKNVTRLAIAELMGAYGAALYARENETGQSSLISPKELHAFTHKAVAATCGRCTNRCSLTVNTFADGGRFISGNKCERGAGAEKASSLPNMMRRQYEQLISYPLKGGERLRVGIPLVLNMYENLPFWSAFFVELGCEVILSGESSRELYMKGQHTIASDTVCYPAKLVHGHIEELAEKNVDVIFYPCMTYNFDEGISDNCYNCPVVAYYPESIAANALSNKAPRFLYPHLSLSDERFFASRIYSVLKDIIPGLTKSQVRAAAKAGYRQYASYRRDILAAGEEALEYAEKNGARVIMMACRPYHADPEVNHGLDKLLTSLGFVIVTDSSVALSGGKRRHNVLNQWTYHARMYNAARIAAGYDNMEMVQLVSFGCGLDAVTSDEIKDILRASGKLYTQLKIDEINNLGAVKIRLRSLKAAMEEREAITSAG
ncbi:MAG: acyl-CoA dehydratase activase [Oscillospiraceae bacterium]|jgi:predicted CoA-substrate-specific enzyme activase|nr:acyl-CoA dehydratase activase [Oscillospiraceae bacterium]